MSSVLSDATSSALSLLACIATQSRVPGKPEAGADIDTEDSSARVVSTPRAHVDQVILIMESHQGDPDVQSAAIRILIAATQNPDAAVEAQRLKAVLVLPAMRRHLCVPDVQISGVLFLAGLATHEATHVLPHVDVVHEALAAHKGSRALFKASAQFCINLTAHHGVLPHVLPILDTLIAARARHWGSDEFVAVVLRLAADVREHPEFHLESDEIVTAKSTSAAYISIHAMLADLCHILWIQRHPNNNDKRTEPAPFDIRENTQKVRTLMTEHAGCSSVQVLALSYIEHAAGCSFPVFSALSYLPMVLETMGRHARCPRVQSAGIRFMAAVIIQCRKFGSVVTVYPQMKCAIEGVVAVPYTDAVHPFVAAAGLHFLVAASGDVELYSELFKDERVNAWAREVVDAYPMSPDVQTSGIRILGAAVARTTDPEMIQTAVETACSIDCRIDDDGVRTAIVELLTVAMTRPDGFSVSSPHVKNAARCLIRAKFNEKVLVAMKNMLVCFSVLAVDGATPEVEAAAAVCEDVLANKWYTGDHEGMKILDVLTVHRSSQAQLLVACSAWDTFYFSAPVVLACLRLFVSMAEDPLTVQLCVAPLSRVSSSTNARDLAVTEKVFTAAQFQEYNEGTTRFLTTVLKDEHMRDLYLEHEKVARERPNDKYGVRSEVYGT